MYITFFLCMLEKEKTFPPFCSPKGSLGMCHTRKHYFVKLAVVFQSSDSMQVQVHSKEIKTTLETRSVGGFVNLSTERIMMS